MKSHRIAIIGLTGTGKTTLGREIAEQCGIPPIDLDDLFWLPGWKMREAEDFSRRVQNAAQGEQWVVTGNYQFVRDIVWAHADTVVWLDYPFLLCCFRLFKRSFRHIRGKIPLCNGNVETWGKFLSKDSIMFWLFTSYRRRKREFGAVLANPAAWPHISFLRFRSPREAQHWLKELS